MVLSIRQLPGSSLAIDILSNIVPVACSSRTFQNRTKQFINRIKSSGQNISNDSYSCMLYDNVPGPGGYVKKASRGGLGTGNSSGYVATARMAVHCW